MTNRIGVTIIVGHHNKEKTIVYCPTCGIMTMVSITAGESIEDPIIVRTIYHYVCSHYDLYIEEIN